MSARQMTGRDTSRPMLIAAVMAITALAIAGCGGGGDDQASGASQASSGDAYPRTVPTRHGDVTIEQQPQRVVALSPTTADELISVGVDPVAVGIDKATLKSTYPWMVDRVADVADPDLVSPNGDLNLEAIAQARPDLVVADPWLVAKKSVFDQLNEIAPAVAPDSKALNVDWDKRLLSTADAVGRTAKAKQLIAEITGEFEKVGSTVPDIGSRTYQLVRVDPDGYGFGNGSLLEMYGLQPADNQDNSQSGPTLSKERTSELNADLLGVWAPTGKLRAGLDDDPLFQALPAVKDGTVFYADLPMATAANTPAPMALRWIEDRVDPIVEKLG